MTCYLPEICMIYDSDMLGICLIYSWHIPQIWLRYNCNISWYDRITRYLLDICLINAWKSVGIYNCAVEVFRRVTDQFKRYFCKIVTESPSEKVTSWEAIASKKGVWGSMHILRNQLFPNSGPPSSPPQKKMIGVREGLWLGDSKT